MCRQDLIFDCVISQYFLGLLSGFQRANRFALFCFAVFTASAELLYIVSRRLCNFFFAARRFVFCFAPCPFRLGGGSFYIRCLNLVKVLFLINFGHFPTRPVERDPACGGGKSGLCRSGESLTLFSFRRDQRAVLTCCFSTFSQLLSTTFCNLRYFFAAALQLQLLPRRRLFSFAAANFNCELRLLFRCELLRLTSFFERLAHHQTTRPPAAPAPPSCFASRAAGAVR